MTETAASTRVPVSIQLIGGLRLLTDPAFDAPGPVPSGDRTLTKTTGPAAAAEEIGPIDAVLLSTINTATTWTGPAGGFWRTPASC
jgi:hypothetical protein